jgi:hypothetical protein
MAAAKRVDHGLRQADFLAHPDMRGLHVVAAPVGRDHDDDHLDFARRQRRALVEVGADLLHAGGDGR